jgi:hypothetical protein
MQIQGIITGIQTTQSYYRRSDNTANTDESTSIGSTGQSDATPQRLLRAILIFGEEVNPLQTYYPPFFPLGSQKRFDLIKKINGLSDMVKQSKMPEKVKKEIEETSSLKPSATNEEISSAIKEILSVGQMISQDMSGADKAESIGKVVDLKV